jgi:hypothetical protein
MRKFALVSLSALLIASVSFAGDTNLDAKALADTVLNMNKSSNVDDSSVSMIYGGEDVSRGTLSDHNKFSNAVMVG